MKAKLKLPNYPPVLVETVERALEPYKKILSPEMVDHFRQEALLQLYMHPSSAALLKKLTAQPVVQSSTAQPVRGANTDTAPEANREGNGRKRNANGRKEGA